MSKSDTDGLFKRGNLAIHISHINSGRTVSFKAFLTNLQESFASSYDEQYFVMHPEPLRKWKSTVRSINLAWRVIAHDTSEAESNLGKISSLASFLYGEQTIVSERGIKFFSQKVGGSPIFRLKLLNLITNSLVGSGPTSGLLGYIENFSYTMSMEQPFFNKEHDAFLQKSADKTQSAPNHGAGMLYPQLMDVQLTFYPVHEKIPAWINQNFTNPRFPHGVNPVYGESSKLAKKAEDQPGKGTDPATPLAEDKAKVVDESIGPRHKGLEQ